MFLSRVAAVVLAPQGWRSPVYAPSRSSRLGKHAAMPAFVDAAAQPAPLLLHARPVEGADLHLTDVAAPQLPRGAGLQLWQCHEQGWLPRPPWTSSLSNRCRSWQRLQTRCSYRMLLRCCKSCWPPRLGSSYFSKPSAGRAGRSRARGHLPVPVRHSIDQPRLYSM